jgi:hypothetical protein
MRMRRSRVHVLAVLALLAALPGLAEGPLSAEALRLLAQVRTAAWMDGLAAQLDGLAAGGRVPPEESFDIVIEAVGPGQLPEAPAEAAAALFAAARQAATARRRGTPLPILRAEIRAAWTAAGGAGATFRLRMAYRAREAAAGFAAGNRRAWDPQYEGRGGSDSMDPGAGPGGRW